MSWIGYFGLGGSELINAARVEKYAGRFGWFRPQFKNTALVDVLGDTPYVDPITDTAPWYDPRHPQSADFLGIYPLDVSGLDDVTTSAALTEGLSDGGSLSASRRAGGAAAFNVMLIATSEAGAEYGWVWMTNTLLGFSAGSTTANGLNLTYLASAPSLGPKQSVTDCSRTAVPITTDAVTLAERLTRQRRRVGLSSPVVETARRQVDGGEIRTATFTLSLPDPFTWSVERPLLDGWRDPLDLNPWASVAPVGAVISDPITVPEVPCLPNSFQPIYDPLAPGVIAPPAAPQITWMSYVPPATWLRRTVTLPAVAAYGYGSRTVPIIRMRTVEETRNIRFRLYPDIPGLGRIEGNDECTFTGDIVVTYLPPASVITIDSADRIVYVDTPDGSRRRADGLVRSSNGGAMIWPYISPGVPHLLVLDLDSAQTAYPVSIDVSLMERYG